MKIYEEFRDFGAELESISASDEFKETSVKFYENAVVQKETEINVRSNVTVHYPDDKNLTGEGSFSYIIKCVE